MGDISDIKIQDVDNEVYWTTAGSEQQLVINMYKEKHSKQHNNSLVYAPFELFTQYMYHSKVMYFKYHPILEKWVHWEDLVWLLIVTAAAACGACINIRNESFSSYTSAFTEGRTQVHVA